jgi:SecD/SecF fusion protein
MKSSFTWKISVCVIPIVIAALVVAWASNQYVQGKGGFKLGVDLVGGTILIYEVDLSKFPEGKLPDKWNAQELADRLKRRIDPADLYNVTIRAVSDTRVEIILPTGGKHQIEAEEKAWKALLAEVEDRYPVHHYVAPPGRTTQLVAEINAQFPDVPIEEIQNFVKEHTQPAVGAETVGQLAAAPLGGGILMAAADAAAGRQSPAAWNKLLEEVAKKWPPKGYVIGRGHLGELALQVGEQYRADNPNKDIPQKEIRQFLETQEKGNAQTALTTEGVQEVKEKVSQVGSLEFMIVANTTNDSKAIEAAEDYLRSAAKNQETRDELERRAIAGLAPPTLNNGEKFDTNLGTYGYSWVELGAAYREEHGLNNPRDRQGRLLDEADIERLLKGEDLGPDKVLNPWWRRAAEARAKGEAVRFPIHPNDTAQLGLLYNRRVQNLRLADKDRDKRYEYFFLMRDPETPQQRITGEDLDDASVQGGHVQFRLKISAADRFYDFTKKNIGQPMAIILDGYIATSPNIKQGIHADGVIEGRFTETQLKRLVTVLRAGALPATLKPDPVSENTMGPTLGEDTIRSGMISVGIAFAAVLAFMLVYYRFAGMVACVALLANLLLTVAFMVLVQATFTLPGLAGLVLMLGMAVDANVLIYERLREERDRGASLALAIRNGYDRAFPTIIDTHLSSIFTAIVLYVVGNDQLKGFGISLTVGLIISLFTSLYMTRVMFDYWLAHGWLHKLSMFRLLSKPNIDFMAIRYYWFTATILLTIAGASVFVYRLDKGGLNIDFTGGTAYGGQLTKPIAAGGLRALFDEKAQKEWLRVEDVKQVDKEGKVFQITYQGDPQPHTVTMDRPTTVEDVRQRASTLPESAVEQIFVSSPQYTEGDKSSFFTLRTSEKSADLVQIEINRLLEHSDDPLKKILLKDWKIQPNNKVVTLSFVQPPPSEKPDYASRAQVARILSRQFDLQGLKSIGEQMVLEGLGKEEDGRFQWMELKLPDPVPPEKLDQVLKATQAQFQAHPQPERLENFDSQLAAETQQRALYAILASWAAILLYLWFRFGNWTFGMAAVLCLIHDLFFTLGIIAFSHWLHGTWIGDVLALRDFKIDLPTVAALLTLVGYSVSDTIVVFDRIREVRGKNPDLTPQMINDSVNQTLSRTLLTALSVWLVVTVLYVWGGEGVHLFAFVMVVGVIVGTYSSIYIASPLLLIFGEGHRAGAAVREQQPQPTGTSA